MKSKLALFSIVAFVTGGCATVAAKTELVSKRAAFDLGCPSDQISYSELGNNVFGASGCGKKASYVVECKDPSAIASCTAIMNSDSDKK